MFSKPYHGSKSPGVPLPAVGKIIRAAAGADIRCMDIFLPYACRPELVAAYGLEIKIVGPDPVAME